MVLMSWKPQNRTRQRKLRSGGAPPAQKIKRLALVKRYCGE
jgi:hypothetical protein